MSFLAKRLDFTIGLGLTGTTVTVAHGLGETPKAIVLTLSGRGGVANGSTSTDQKRGFGWAIGAGAGQQYAFANRANNATAVGTQSCRGRGESGICILELNNTGTVLGSAKLQSWDATNLVFEITDGFNVDYRIIGWVLGGSDITNLATGEFTSPAAGAAPFDTDVTGLGFTGSNGRTLLLLASVNEPTLASAGTDSSMMIGAATSPTQRGVVWTMGDHNSNPTDVFGYSQDAQVAALSPAAAASPMDWAADFGGWIAGGFRLSTTQRNGATGFKVAYLVINGPRFAVKSAVTSTVDATTVAVTGAGFQPVSGFVFGARVPESTLNTPGTGTGLTFGFYDATNQGTVAAEEADAQTVTSQTAVGVGVDGCYMGMNPVSGATSAKMGRTSLDVDGVTYTMSNGDDGAYQFFSVLAGAAPGGDTVIVPEGVVVGTAVPINMLGWDVEAPIVPGGFGLGVLLGQPSFSINNAPGGETPPPSEPGFNAQTVMDAARDRHASFDKYRHPDAILLRTLDRAQRVLQGKAIQRNAQLFAATYAFTFPLTDFAAGAAIPFGYVALTGAEVVLIDGARLPCDIIPYGQRDQATASYAVWVLGSQLFFKGDTGDWAGVTSVRVSYVPVIDKLTSLSAVLTLPRSAEDVLVNALAAFMAVRGHNDPQLPSVDARGMIALAEASESAWLNQVAAQKRSQIKTIREVW